MKLWNTGTVCVRTCMSMCMHCVYVHVCACVCTCMYGVWRHWWFHYPGELLDIEFEFTLFIRAN